MRRESRILLVIGVLAVVGVTALALMADRYRRLAERAGIAPAPEANATATPALPAPTPGPVTDALAARWVDGFLAVRREVRAEIEGHGEVVFAVLEDGSDRVRRDLPPAVIEAYGSLSERIRRHKREALADARMAEADYDRVREAVRVLRAGERDAADPLARAIEARRAAIEAADLGRFERFDLALEP